MLILAPGFVVSADTDTNANSPCIGYHNLCTTTTVSASSTATGYPVTNLGNPLTYSKWKGASAAAINVFVDVSGYGDLIDYVGIARHNFGTKGITVDVYGDAGAGYVLLGSVAPADDSPLIFRFAPAIYNTIKVALGAGSAAPSMAVLYVGKLLVAQRRIYVGHTPITLAREDDVTGGVSEEGDFLGRIITGSTNANAISWANFTPGWYRLYFAPFILAARTKPWFFAWRPSTYPLEVGFCWLSNQPKPVNDLPNGMMRIDLQTRGIVL
jgi:hypothetical protein